MSSSGIEPRPLDDLFDGQLPASEATPAYLPRIAKGAMINLSGTASRTVLAYGYTVMLARMLQVSALGYYFLIVTIGSILGLASVVGLDLGVVRYVSLYAGSARFRMARRTLAIALMIAIPISVALMVATMLLAPSVAARLMGSDPAAVTALRIFAISIPFWVAAKLFNATTQGLHWMRYQVYSRDIGEQLIKFFLTAALLVAGAGLAGVIWANVAALVIATLMSMMFALKVLPMSADRQTNKRPVSQPIEHLFRYSLPLAFSNILGIVLVWADLLMLGFLRNSTEVGYYGAALRVGVASSALFLAFATVFMPVISDLYNKRRGGELGSLYKTVTRWVFVFTLPLVLLQLLFAGTVMKMFGGGFTSGSTALMILALSQLINAAAGPAGSMVIMSGRSRLELVNITFSLIIDIAVCLILIPRYGLIGAAIANAAATAAINVMRAAEVWLLMRTHAYDSGYLKSLAAAAAAAAAVLMMELWIRNGGGVIRIAFQAVVMVAVYLAVTMALGLSVQDKLVLRLVWNRLPGVGEG